MTANEPLSDTTTNEARKRGKTEKASAKQPQQQQDDGNLAHGTQGENDTLVKYEQPILLSKTTDNDSLQPPNAATSAQLENYKKWKATLGEDDKKNDNLFDDDTSLLQNKNIATGQGFKASEEILDAILPPREWLEAGQRWVQRVSRIPPTRLDVMNLHEQLDIKLEQLHARESGIDPIRRELYSQCFDELIRQVTIKSPERGLLLLRIRDEFRMTLVAFQGLFESSIAYGTRKSILTEQGSNEQQDKLSDLKQQRADMNKEINEWKVKSELIEKKYTELRQLDEKRHQEEIHNLKRTNQQLKNQLEGIINPKAMMETNNAAPSSKQPPAVPSTQVAPAV